MKSILTFGALVLVLMFVFVGYTDQKDPGHLVSELVPIADIQEMCCCEYVVQDNLDPASHSVPHYAWITVDSCWAGYNDPLTIGRQARPSGRCVSAALCGKKRL